MHLRVAAVQQKILIDQEAKVVGALGAISLVDSATHPGASKPLPEGDYYRIDRAWRIVAHIAEIKDEVAHLLDTAKLIRGAVAGSDNLLVKVSLDKLANLETSATEYQTRLFTISWQLKDLAIVAI